MKNRIQTHTDASAAGDVVAAVTNNLPRDVGATMPTLRAMKQNHGRDDDIVTP